MGRFMQRLCAPKLLELIVGANDFLELAIEFPVEESDYPVGLEFRILSATASVQLQFRRLFCVCDVHAAASLMPSFFARSGFNAAIAGQLGAICPQQHHKRPFPPAAPCLTAGNVTAAKAANRRHDAVFSASSAGDNVQFPNTLSGRLTPPAIDLKNSISEGAIGRPNAARSTIFQLFQPRTLEHRAKQPRVAHCGDDVGKGCSGAFHAALNRPQPGFSIWTHGRCCQPALPTVPVGNLAPTKALRARPYEGGVLGAADIRDVR